MDKNKPNLGNIGAKGKGKDDEMLIFIRKRLVDILQNNFLGIRYHKIEAPISILYYLGAEIEPTGDDSIGPPSLSTITMKLREKVMQVQTFQVSASLQRSAIEDIKNNFGIDLIAKTLDVLLDEFKYSIDKMIIEEIDKNSEEFLNTVTEEIPQQMPAYKILINRFLTSIRVLINGKKIFKPVINVVQVNKPFDLKSGRQFVSKIMACCNKIAVQTRRGPGNFVICNVAVGAVLQNEQNFVTEPLNSIITTGGSIYQLGVLNNIPIYVNPNMTWNSDYFYVGRKEVNASAPDSIGMNIGHYEDGISLQTIAEETMAPKLSLSARLFIEELSDMKGRYFKVKYNPDNMIGI